jgi:hypothetical protein
MRTTPVGKPSGRAVKNRDDIRPQPENARNQNNGRKEDE